MKKQKFYRAMALCLTLLMVLSTTVFAAESRASEYLSAFSATAAKTRDGDIAVSCSVTGSKKMDSIGVSRIEIQWYNASRWTTEEIYTSSDLSNLQASNSIYVSGKFIHTPEESGSYRALVTVYAEDGSGSDSRVVTTATVKI